MNSPLRALLVDDERPALKQLRSLLLEHPAIEVIGEAGDVKSAAAFAKREAPDVIFLDIQMPGGSGFELLPLLDPLPGIVFVTAFDQFAVRAFEANALDYLTKPVHPNRLAATVARLLRRPVLYSASPIVGEGGGKIRPQDMVVLRDSGKMRIVQAREIAWIEAEGIYSRLWLDGNGQFQMLRSIGEWEAILPEEMFARLDRSLLVNLCRIKQVNALDRNLTNAWLQGMATPLSLGRTAAARLRTLLR